MGDVCSSAVGERASDEGAVLPRRKWLDNDSNDDEGRLSPSSVLDFRLAKGPKDPFRAPCGGSCCPGSHACAGGSAPFGASRTCEKGRCAGRTFVAPSGKHALRKSTRVHRHLHEHGASAQLAADPCEPTFPGPILGGALPRENSGHWHGAWGPPLHADNSVLLQWPTPELSIHTVSTGAVEGWRYSQRL